MFLVAVIGWDNVVFILLNSGGVPNKLCCASTEKLATINVSHGNCYLRTVSQPTVSPSTAHHPSDMLPPRLLCPSNYHQRPTPNGRPTWVEGAVASIVYHDSTVVGKQPTRTGQGQQATCCARYFACAATLNYTKHPLNVATQAPTNASVVPERCSVNPNITVRTATRALISGQKANVNICNRSSPL